MTAGCAQIRTPETGTGWWKEQTIEGLEKRIDEGRERERAFPMPL